MSCSRPEPGAAETRYRMLLTLLTTLGGVTSPHRRQPPAKCRGGLPEAQRTRQVLVQERFGDEVEELLGQPEQRVLQDLGGRDGLRGRSSRAAAPCSTSTTASRLPAAVALASPTRAAA